MNPTIVDTSAWRRFFRGDDQGRVFALVRRGRALVHPWVEGELSLGNTPKIALQHLAMLPRTRIASAKYQTEFIRDRNLSGRRVGWVDVQILATASLMGCEIVTADQWLAKQASRLEIPVQLLP